MSIAETFGHDIEIESFNKKVEANNKTIINQMNTTINNAKDGNVINTVDAAKIKATINITKGDKKALKKKLLEEGIIESDTNELIEIIDTEKPDNEKGTFGNKVNGWMQKMIGKALDGSGQISVGAAGTLLAEVIQHYYGVR